MKRLWMVFVAMLTLLPLAGCWTDNDADLEGGIRVYNYVRLGLFASRTPVANAVDRGAASYMGPVEGSMTLNGVSNQMGIYDAYDVTLGVDWDFTWDYSIPYPNCTVASDILYISSGGGHATGECDLI